jgi:hypothetical protein
MVVIAMLVNVKGAQVLVLVRHVNIGSKPMVTHFLNWKIAVVTVLAVLKQPRPLEQRPQQQQLN